MKNPFKLKNATSTLMSTAIGGAANVAYDYVYSKIAPSVDLSDTTKNAIKIALGAIGGSMVSKSWAKDACTGIAVVGVSNLIAGYMPNGEGAVETETPAGLPQGMIGRVRMGQRGFRRGVRGVAAAPDAFMSK